MSFPASFTQAAYAWTVLHLLLSCSDPPGPDPLELWLSDRDAATAQIAALPEADRNLLVLRLAEAHPGETQGLCELASGPHAQRCQRMNERPHLWTPEVGTRAPTRWMLPADERWTSVPADSGDCADSTCLVTEAVEHAKQDELQLTAARCNAVPQARLQRDCYFQAAEYLGRLDQGLSLCKATGQLSAECAGHVVLGLNPTRHGEAMGLIEAAELGDAEAHVKALWWTHEVYRLDLLRLPEDLPPDALPHVHNREALGTRPLSQPNPNWTLLLPPEQDLDRVQMHPQRPELRPSSSDVELDRELAQLHTAAMLQTPDLTAVEAAAVHPDRLMRWSAALLLTRLAPEHALIETLASDEDPLVRERARMRPPPGLGG
jgi:hypothetical protein